MYKVSLSSDDSKSTILPNVTDGRKDGQTDGRTDKASYRVASLLKITPLVKGIFLSETDVNCWQDNVSINM